jgi:phage tail sheath protein FI
MSQYLAPGVYVEEIPGPETIQAVGTNTAGFVGPCRFGPTSGRPELVTSFLDYVRIFGDWDDLVFDDNGEFPNYMALGVKGFFDEGGTSLYVVRTFNYTDTSNPQNDHASAEVVTPDSTPSVPPLTLRARFPGAAGRMQVTLALQAGRNALVDMGGTATLTRVHEYDLVYAGSGSGTGRLYVVRLDPLTGTWRLQGSGGLALTSATFAYPLTAAVSIRRPAVNSQGLPTLGPPQNVGVFGFDPRAIGTGITTVLTANPPTRSQALTVPVAIEGTDDLGGVSVAPDDLPGLIAEALFGGTILSTASEVTTSAGSRQVVVMLSGGSDGDAPIVTTYEGNPTFADYQNDLVALPFNGLLALEACEDVSIVAAPGASTGWSSQPAGQTTGIEINDAVVTHCENLLYRVAAIDTPVGFLPDDALDYRNNRSSKYAALYYPWITIADPIDGSLLKVPPAPFMAGIWARSDINFGSPIKAPANEPVRSAIDLEIRVNKAQQELLNPEGVNCLRYFPGPGFLVWGARTISDDPEWKYLSMRRYFCYLEKSIDLGTQWVVFGVNGPHLWDAVRHTVENFLLDEWKSGALLGVTPAEAYFVKCDASTMTADDLANGRLVCQIGVAAAAPAEFVIFQIGQWTASATS